MPLFAGLDLGTTHTKLLVLDETGALVHQSKFPYTKGFGARLDPLELKDLSAQLLTTAFSYLQERGAVIYLAISAAMHSLMLVDERCMPISSLTTWADTDSQPVVARRLRETGIQAIVQETGTPFHPMTPLAKLLAFREQEPDLLDRAYKCIGIKEFIWYHLTGRWETDVSMAAATGLYDPLVQAWHPLALELTGVRYDQLPEIRAVDWTIASIFNQQPVFFVLGGSDGCLAQVGSCAMRTGVASLTIGTSGAMRVVQPAFQKNTFNGLFSYQLDQQHYVCGGPTNNGGIVLQWWQEKIMGETASLQSMLNDFEEEASSVAPGCEGLVCLPYFGGERAPVWDADASGIFAGVKLRHQQAHFKRSMVEGICFIFRQLMERIESRYGSVEKIIVSGGFTQSAWWVQVLADILERPVHVNSEDADASALGAIGVALKAAGQITEWTDMETWLPFNYTVCAPDETLSIVYQNQYQQFLRLCHL